MPRAGTKAPSLADGPTPASGRDDWTFRLRVEGQARARAARIEPSGPLGSLSDVLTTIGALEMEQVRVRDRETLPAEPDVAFAKLAEEHLDAAYRLATFILAGDRSDAEDAVHDAAVRAWRHFSGR